MLKWLRQFDWGAIFGSALILVLALWFLAAHPGDVSKPAAYENPFQYFYAALSCILGILPPEGWTALFTAFLTVSTYFLWTATKRAAEIAERSLKDLERPWLFVIASKADGILIDPPFIELQVVNYGRTVGEIRSIKSGIRRTAAKDIEVGTMTLAKIESSEVGNIVPPGGDPIVVTLRFPPPTDKNATAFTAIGEYKFIVRAEIHYTGLLKEPGETAFCFLYDASKHQFARCGGEKYNYTK